MKAESICERHRTLTKVLMKAGAGKELAEENACRIEHVVSDEMMEVFRNFISDKKGSATALPFLCVAK